MCKDKTMVVVTNKNRNKNHFGSSGAFTIRLTPPRAAKMVFLFKVEGKMGGRKKIDLTGKRFERLVVIKEVGQNKHKAVLWECLCDCGNTVVAIGGNLRVGCIKSCGCLKKEIIGSLNRTHGMTRTPTYETWKHISTRCNNQNSKDYKDYGGRGINVCKRWLKFENFLEDMGLKPEGLSIDRIDNNLGYFKENCRWASSLTQRRNQRLRKTNTTGTEGVAWDKRCQKYQAYIYANFKRINLGLFKALPEAAEARRLGEIKYWGKNYD